MTKTLQLAHRYRQRGAMLPVAVMVLFVLLAVGMVGLTISAANYRVSRTDHREIQAQLAADAGIDIALQEISQSSSWSPPSGETVVMNTNGARTTYELDLRTAGSNLILTATGRTYFPDTATSPTATQSYEVVAGVTSSGGLTGDFSLIAGYGGVIMSNSARAEGNMYILGPLSMSIAAEITTGSGNALRVANVRCPISGGASFPRACTSGEANNPISISGGAEITGSVYANYQTDGDDMASPGLVSGSGTAVDIYEYPRPPARGPITSGYTSSISGSSAGCFSGSRTWPANLRITSSVTIRNCTVTIGGNIWIQGNLSSSNSTTIRIANGVSEKPIIMIDGSSGLSIINSLDVIPNSSGVGARFITYWSDAPCSPDCADVSGDNLKNSIDDYTISINNSGYAPGSEFFAAWSGVSVSNNSGGGAVGGQRIYMAGDAELLGNTSLTISDSGSSPAGLEIKSYRRAY